MSRSRFALAVALVVIAATLIFVKSFPSDAAGDGSSRVGRPVPGSSGWANAVSDRTSSAAPRLPRPASESRLEIGFAEATLAPLTDDQRHQVLAIASKAQAEARASLDDLTATYNLSRQQQRDIFPLVASHSPSYHPSMAVNGVSVPLPAAGSSLEADIHGALDATQQAALEDAMLDDIKWWQEIAGQLEDDLNSAIDAGEVQIGDPAGTDAPVLSTDTQPAEGHGEAASHSIGNIFDLLDGAQ